MATILSFLRGHMWPQSLLPLAAAIRSQFLDQICKANHNKRCCLSCSKRRSCHIRLNTINSSTLAWFLSSFPNLAWEKPSVSYMMVRLEGIFHDSTQGSGWWRSSDGFSFMSMRPKLARHYPFSHQPAEDFHSGHCLKKRQRRESSSALERTNSSVWDKAILYCHYNTSEKAASCGSEMFLL